MEIIETTTPRTKGAILWKVLIAYMLLRMRCPGYRVQPYLHAISTQWFLEKRKAVLITGLKHFRRHKLIVTSLATISGTLVLTLSSGALKSCRFSGKAISESNRRKGNRLGQVSDRWFESIRIFGVVCDRWLTLWCVLSGEVYAMRFRYGHPMWTCSFLDIIKTFIQKPNRSTLTIHSKVSSFWEKYFLLLLAN